MSIIKIADRYPCPGPRFIKLGPASGEEFRDTWLKKTLHKSSELTIDLDGTDGYGSSFLEESFGGLVRSGEFSDDVILGIKFITTEEPELEEEILDYITDAINDRDG
ncbi:MULTISPECIES: STAS-like domain-containing protein [Vibrio]|uniref:STAS-like domain-containing protein n=1 Tax=Vibrio TaxID=662 RepID=UPI0002F881F9|nr:STAS-like domain-containing protein [Vibrio tasmaniensis]OEF86830.1 hypothetical protein A162_23955 [Vibrio tasmaniensis 1F-155]